MFIFFMPRLPSLRQSYFPKEPIHNLSNDDSFTVLCKSSHSKIRHCALCWQSVKEDEQFCRTKWQSVGAGNYNTLGTVELHKGLQLIHLQVHKASFELLLQFEHKKCLNYNNRSCLFMNDLCNIYYVLRDYFS